MRAGSSVPPTPARHSGRLRNSPRWQQRGSSRCVTLASSCHASPSASCPASSTPCVSTRLRFTSMGGGPESKSMALRNSPSNQVALQRALPSSSAARARSRTTRHAPARDRDCRPVDVPSAYSDGSLKALPQAPATVKPESREFVSDAHARTGDRIFAVGLVDAHAGLQRQAEVRCRRAPRRTAPTKCASARTRWAARSRRQNPAGRRCVPSSRSQSTP